MAQIVSVVASTHNPRIFWNRDQATPADMDELYATFGEVRDLLAATKPDVLVVVANDHLDNYFFDNLPTFSVGTGPSAEGPFWYESDIMSLPHYKFDIHQPFAEYILRDGVETGIQFSQARELHLDHAFTVPLSFLRPGADLPVVPIVTNAFGYPIGGPKMGNIDLVFARYLLELMSGGKRDEILEKLTVERLIEAGNSTVEFLNYVTALGVVEDQLPTFIRHKPVKGVGTCPIAFWNL